MRYKNLLLVPLSLFVMNLVNLIVQVSLPKFLAVEEYARYTLFISFGLFISAFFFEAARVALIRFAFGSDSLLSEKRQSILAFYYFWAVSALLVVVFFLGICGVYYSLAFVFASILLYSVSQGIFEGKQALARASLNNVVFSNSGLIKSFVVLVIVPCVAFYYPYAEVVIIALALAQFLAVTIYDRNGGLKFLRKMSWEKREAVSIFGFGFYVFVSSFFVNLVPVAIKYYANNYLDLMDSGGFLLSFDYSQKFIGVLGMVLNVILLQRTIRKIEFSDLSGRMSCISRHVANGFAVFMPFVILLYGAQPLLMNWFVPESYSSSYEFGLVPCLLCASILAFRAIVLDGIFLITAKSKMAFVPPVVFLISFFLILVIIEWFDMQVEIKLGGAMLASSIFSVICSVFITSRLVVFKWPIKDIFVILLGSGGMFLLIHNFVFSRLLWLDLVEKSFLALSIYFAIIVALDFSGFRFHVVSFLKLRIRQ